MEEEVVYWEVTYRNLASEERWTVVKCPFVMVEEEIWSRMMGDSEVAGVYSVVETDRTDYSRDFTELSGF